MRFSIFSRPLAGQLGVALPPLGPGCARA